ncbi:MAG: DUF2096 family protein [Candidatus Thorarchaeota archaeon]
MVTLKGLLYGWSVLNEMIGEVRQLGGFIPDQIYADLRNSRVALEYLLSVERGSETMSDSDLDLRAETEAQILALRDSFVTWSEELGGRETRESWEQRFEDAIYERVKPEPDEPTVSISDLPREKGIGFFRIRLQRECPPEIISEIAEECRVNISFEGDRYLRVTGKDTCVRDAMKRLGELLYPQETD